MTPRSLFARLKLGCLFLATFALVACASPQPMPFSAEKSASVKNLFGPKHQPVLLYLNVESEDGTRQRFYVAPEAKARDSSAQDGSKFLVRFQLQPGNYRLLGFSGQTFPIVGNFFMPLHVDFSVPAGGTHYLGDANGVNRKAKEGEYLAGPSFPPIEQNLTGFSGGTFDVTVEDLSAQDIPVFLKRFPLLNDQPIEKRLLPQPDRQRALEYWKNS